LRRFRIVTILLAGALLTLACGGSSGSSTTSGGTTAKKIALLLPESKTARYESKDRPLFTAKLMALCSNCTILYSNANQDAAQQQSQAEAALTNGANVLVLDAVDGAAAAAIAIKAKAAKVPVISYDRLITGTDAVNYYVSFDNAKVGQLQGNALLTALGSKTNPNVVFINGSPTDNNASLFKQGAHSVLDGKITKVAEYDTPDWSPDKAQTEMTQALTAAGSKKIDGVLAANDGTGGGAIAAMKAAGIKPLPPVTGQDAELAAIQRIVQGDQYMTVYKAIKAEAEAAAQLAFTVSQGKTPDSSTVNGKTNNKSIDVPSVLLVPVAVTKANIQTTVIADGFWTKTDICTADFAAACTAAGIS
jgi:D-xylose transport system substrate-binding protein